MPKTLASKYRKDLQNAILGYLTRWGSIDPPTAASKFECFTLQQEIYRLRKKGYRIIGKGRGKHRKYTMPEVAEKYKVNSTES